MIALPLAGHGPLYRQLYHAVRDAIQAGRLAAGTRLPSTRSLSTQLGLSRKVVLMAFRRLEVEGFVRGRVGAGTYVTGGHARFGPKGNGRKPEQLAVGEAPRPSRWGRHVLRQAAAGSKPGMTPEPEYDFRLDRSDPIPLFPSTWRRLLSRQAHGFGTAAATWDTESAVRRAVAEYSALMRAFPCDPEQVIPASSAGAAMDLIARALVDPGESVGVEAVCDPAVASVFQGVGATLRAVPIDREGVRPDELPSADSPLRALHVTPAHQRPTGGTLPPGRRQDVIRWAARTGTVLLEDDRDGLFYFERSVLAPLAAASDGARVVHLGEVHPPEPGAQPMTYLVVPEELAALFHAARRAIDPAPPTLEQLATGQCILEGHYSRVLQVLHRRYDARRRRLLAALRDHFGSEVAIQGEQTGLHVVVWLPQFRKEAIAVLRDRAVEQGVGVEVIEASVPGVPATAAMAVGYRAIPADRIEEGVARLARAVAGSVNRRWRPAELAAPRPRALPGTPPP